MTGGGRYIFASDMHLGAAGCPDAEAHFVSFLADLPSDTRALYLLGDVFDFWFEQHGGCPAGFENVLDAIAAVVNRGVEVYFFKGNHDWWTFGYLASRTGAHVVHRQPVCHTLAGKRFCLAHGDGLGPLDLRERCTQLFLKGRVTIALARITPTRWLYGWARRWSGASRHSNDLNPYTFDTGSPLYRFACDFEKEQPVDYFIFGHIHRSISLTTPGGATMVILNDWSQGPNWLEFDGETLVRKGGQA